MDMESVFRIHKGNDEYKEISHGGTIIWERAISKTASGDGTQFMPTRSSTSYAALSAVTAFGGTEQRNLPAGYTQLKYIQTDSNSWIDTNVAPTATTLRIDYKMQLLEQAYISFFGSVASTTPRNGLRIYYQPASSATSWSVQSGSGIINQVIVWDSVLQGSVVATQYDSIVSTVNGDTATTSGGGINLTNPDSILIGTTHLGSNISGIAPVKIWSFTITKDGSVVFDGIPAKNSSDVVGMYDLVSGTFFTNAGTGTLTAGDPAVPTPDAPMDIVCNNGVLKYGRYGENLANEEATSWDVFGSSGRVGVSLSESGYYSVRVRVKGTIPEGCYVGLGSVRPGESSWTVTNWLILNGSINPSFGGFYSREITGTQLGLNVVNVPDPQTFYENVEVMLVKGEYTSETMPPYEPYKFGLYADGTTETIWAHGKNLWDGKMYRGQLFQGRPYIYNNTEITSPFTSIGAYSGVGLVVKVIPGQQYCFSSDATNVQYRYVGFYANREDVTDYTKIISYAASNTATTPAGANYAVFCCVNATSGTEFSWTWAQAEYGSTTTPYEPYYDGGTATCENLLSIGDYTDVQEVLSGNVTRKVGIKVFDGTESWNSYNVTQGVLFRTQISDAVSGAKDSLGVLCNAYQVVASGFRMNGTLTGSATNYDFLNDNYTTADAWKAYLAAQYAAGTPVIIVYPLATETTESVTGQPMSVVKDVDYVQSVVTASLDGLNIESTYLGK